MVKLDEGKFSAAQYPQLTDIAETVDRRRGCTFILRFPPQTHKSLFMQLRLARTIAVGPQRSLWYCVTGKDADDFSDEKLTPLLESCQPVLARLPYDPRDRGGKKIFKFKAPLSLLSSEVQAHRNQRSAKDLYLDEAWQYPHGAVAEIRARSDSFQAVRRIIIGETGPDEGGETDLLFQRSPQKTWMVSCPLCNRPVELEFGDAETESGIKWDKNEKTCNSEGFWNAELAARTVRWVCPACHGVVKYSPGILATMNSPARNAGYEIRNHEPDPVVEGWTANAFCFRDWRELVTEWLDACNAKRLGDLSLLEEFTRKKLCKPWSPTQHFQTRVEYPIGDYNLAGDWDGELTHPLGFKCRFVSVDVQQNCYWCVCRMWGKYGRSRLRGFARCFSEPEVAEFAKQHGVDPAFVFTDTAYDPKDPDSKGAMWGRTMRMCSEYGFVAVNGISEMGFKHEDGSIKLYAPDKKVDAFLGTNLFGRKKQVLLVNYSSRGSKFLLHNLRAQKDEAGLARWTVAADTPQEYLKQAYAERLRKKKSSKGATYWEWFQIADNHAFDLECIQVVVAYMFSIIGGEGAVTADVGVETTAAS